ncbi:TonB family C-terminal domain-containing protein [Hymenobacter mucosus]|uniref:TonB family C-terminal domain-containing protein n=2 Tax=Hymenobacteraceae TaxID=1853232 RepID=A0A238V9M2_9BACT|nr:TonB family C-terminal domain-containing protein [Hymenobacter mucosus]
MLVSSCRESGSHSIFRDEVASTQAPTPPEASPDLPPQSSSDLVPLAEPAEQPKAAAEVAEEKAYTFVEQMPEFPGGMQALLAHITRQVRYPAAALRDGVEGKVFVKFIVGEDGAVRNAKIEKGIGSGCDEEALRAIQALPAFRAGKQNGRPVPVYLTVPISFSAQPN